MIRIASAVFDHINKSIFMLRIHGMRWVRYAKRLISAAKPLQGEMRRVNLCCGTGRIPGYYGIDHIKGVDLCLDLSKNDLPFKNNSLDAVVCMSAINYFTYKRGQELVGETYRVLRTGGIARFGVQDMESIAQRYVQKDTDFFFQKLPNGIDRFEGPTLGDKFAAWFYGYEIKGFPCRYFYDYNSLAHLFISAGFTIVEKRAFLESRLDHIDKIDNRPEQMFYLEAVK